MQIASVLPVLVMTPLPGGLPLIGAVFFAVFQASFPAYREFSSIQSSLIHPPPIFFLGLASILLGPSLCISVCSAAVALIV
jgi:hypothetical protein